MAKRAEKLMTVREVAEQIDAGESSVRLWAKEGRFPGAKLEETRVGSYWLIPEAALVGFTNPGRGRPSTAKAVAARKRSAEKKRATKKRSLA